MYLRQFLDNQFYVISYYMHLFLYSVTSLPRHSPLLGCSRCPWRRCAAMLVERGERQLQTPPTCSQSRQSSLSLGQTPSPERGPIRETLTNRSVRRYSVTQQYGQIEMKGFNHRLLSDRPWDASLRQSSALLFRLNR